MSNERRNPDLSEQQVNRLLRSYLREEWHEDANRVASSVLDELDTTPQRRSGWTAWRSSVMNNSIVRVGLAAAAVVVIAIIAINLLPGTTPPGGSPSVSPSVAPSVEPSEAAPLPSADAFLPEGPILLWDPSLEQPPGEGPTITVTITSQGWLFHDDSQYLQKGPADEDDRLGGDIVWPGSVPSGTGFYVYGDPCAWQSTTPETPATTVDEIVAAMASQASRNAKEPSDVTIGGYAGKTITLYVPNDADFAACDDETFATYEIGVDGGQPPTAQAPGQIDQYWILDVEGWIVFIDAWSPIDSPNETMEEMQAIVESATFEFP